MFQKKIYFYPFEVIYGPKMLSGTIRPLPGGLDIILPPVADRINFKIHFALTVDFLNRFLYMSKESAPFVLYL